MRFDSMTVEQQVTSLAELANQFARAFELEPTQIESVNHGFNSTFKVTCDDGEKFALRINVNSRRSVANAVAEVAWIESLKNNAGISAATPLRQADGSPVATVDSPLLGRSFTATCANWLEGDIVATLDDPSDALRSAGQLLAHLHLTDASIRPLDGQLPVFNTMFYGYENFLTGINSALSKEDQTLFGQAIDRVMAVVDALYVNETPRVIHADVHAGNLMWHNGKLSLFDFDDCGLGFPIQDIAIALSYIPDPGFRSMLLEEYEKVTALPQVSVGELETLILQRRLQLLNYFASSQNPQHRAMFERFLAGARTQIESFLSN